MIVWLSSYPRSGNTFLRTLLKSCFGYDTYSIYNDDEIGGDPSLSALTGHQNLKHRFGSPDFDLTSIRESDDLHFLKTHQPSRDLVAVGDKVIYIARDGREATLSFQRYMSNYHNTGTTLVELLLGEVFPFASWSDHIAGWAPREHEDTLLILFEDLISDPKASVECIASFLDIRVVAHDFPTFDELHKINPQFFTQGKRDSFEQGLSDVSHIEFILANIRQMLELGYARSLPSSIDDVAADALLLFEKGWRQSVERLKKDRADSFKQIGHQQNVISARDSQIQLQADVIGSKDEEIQQLKEAFQSKEEEIQRLNDAIESNHEQLLEQQEDIEKKNDELVDIRGLLERQNRQIASLRNEVENKNERLIASNEVIERANEDLDKRDLHIAEIEGQLNRSKRAIDLMEQSRSWKITKPLRSVRQLFARD